MAGAKAGASESTLLSPPSKCFQAEPTLEGKITFLSSPETHVSDRDFALLPEEFCEMVLRRMAGARRGAGK